MKILIIGGTVFLGRALVEVALSHGHQVTLFNRGRTNPDLFPQVEKLVGDRDGNLKALAGRGWDAVLDTSGYVPRVVRQSVQALSAGVDHYTFISSLSVYADSSQPGVGEDGPLATIPDPSVEEITGDTYGALKALCEQVVAETLPGRSLILRPGLIVGPHDRSDRFTYWPHRVAQGGQVLVPGSPGRLLQFIDVRDLAEWNIRLVEAGKTGIYNANGPKQPVPMGELLEVCRTVSGSAVDFTWVDEKFLLDQGVEPWMELPLWIPESDTEAAGFFAFDISKALLDGLAFRPLTETVRDTLAWDASRPPDHDWRAGLASERESELLDLWQRQVSSKASGPGYLAT